MIRARIRTLSSRLPPARWWVQAGVAAGVVAVFVVYLGARFDIRIDPQAQRCIPGARAFLVDRYDREPEIGDLVAFTPPNLEPLFEPGVQFVKQVAGTTGDAVAVGLQETRIGDRVVARGLGAADAIGVEPERFVRRTSVPADSLWMVAPGPQSIDSRYWGPLERSRVIGTAYELF